MDATLRLDVYPTDADAFEAVAALAAERLRDSSDRATVALAGGRSGRGVMVALAGRGDVPWDRIDWFWSDDRCVPADDPQSNVRLARESLLVPRGVPAGRIFAPPAEGEPGERAAGYASTVGSRVFDVVLLGLGVRGSLGSLAPGCSALGASSSVAAVSASEVVDDPRVARITVTPPVLRVARQVIVV